MKQDLVKLSEIFDLKYGINLELNKLDIVDKKTNDDIFFVSRTEKNNGVSAIVKKVKKLKPNPAYTLSVAASGTVLSTFVQFEEYYSGRDLYYLKPKKSMSEKELVFYAWCIRKNKYRYNYGRQANRTLKDILVPAKMPVNLAKVPIPNISKKPFHNKKLSLSDREWEWFDIKDIFSINLGKPIHKREIEEIEFANNQDIAYVTRTTANNGIELFLSELQINEKMKLQESNAITIGAEGFEAFYQEKKFITGNKVNILRNIKLNQYIGLFLCKILNLEIKKRFSYGRGLVKSRLELLKLKLPITPSGTPDWQFMEDFIKSLPYSGAI
jgi:hypothetical protein